MPKRTRSYHAFLIERLRDEKVAASYLTAAQEDSPEMFAKAQKNVAEARLPVSLPAGSARAD